MSLKILAVSDTHGMHEGLFGFGGVDMIIHAGDYSNHRNPSMNEPEARAFLEWYSKLQIKYKVLIDGNHETSVAAGMISPKDYPDIIYLKHSFTIIEGVKIFGSPYSLDFGKGWVYNIKANRADEYWKQIPGDTDILITHGPPKGILDLSYDLEDNLEYCGDKALFNHVERVRPKYHIFGHIHPNKNNMNAGTRTIDGLRTTFINASCVTDGKFANGLSSRGIKFEI